jgi:hypothetical protein
MLCSEMYGAPYDLLAAYLNVLAGTRLPVSDSRRPPISQ